jgi:hypothetical protein
VLAGGFDESGAGRYPFRDGFRRSVKDYARAVQVRRERYAAKCVSREIAIGWLPGCEAGAGERTPADTINPEGPPVGAAHVPRDYVPAPARVYESVRLDFTLGGGGVPTGVAKAEHFIVPAGACDERESFRIHRRPGTGQRQDVRMERGDTAAQAFRQHLLQFREGAQGGFFDTGHGAAGGGAQSDGYRHCFFVIEEQWRESGARAQLIAARGARGRIDGVTETAQAINIAAEGARGDFEARGEIRAGPVPSGLKQ